MQVPLGAMANRVLKFWAIFSGQTEETLATVNYLAFFTIGKVFYNVRNPFGSNGPPAPQVQPNALGGLDARLDILDENFNTRNTLFFGGSGEETVNGLATDSKGAAYIIGNTRSADLPLVNPIQATRSGGNTLFEGFLAVFTPGTLPPVFATYLGGIGMEFLNGVTVDPQGNIYVVGETFGNFPNPTPGAVQPQLSGRTDAFIIKISPVGIAGPVEFKGSSQAGGGSVLAGGTESGGLARGPAFQLFNTAGVLQTTQFALNPDFRSDLSFVLGNFDADGADEVLVGGRETTGLARGVAYQVLETTGTLKFTQFALNPDFINVSFSSLNVGSNGVLVCGEEIEGFARGPAYQAFDASGNLVRTQFVLNPDFTADNSCLGTNLDGVAGDEVISGGREVTGLGPWPGVSGIWLDGSLIYSFCVEPRFY